MADRDFNEYAASGEGQSLSLAAQLQYLSASASADEGMFLRIGASGFTSLYRAPDQDVHWVGTSNALQLLGSTDVIICTAIIDQDLTPADSFFEFTCQVDNNDSPSRDVVFTIKDDGAANNTRVVALNGSEQGKIVVFAGGFATTYVSGSTVTVEARTIGSNLEIRGDVAVSKMTLTKAQSAPVMALSAEGVDEEFGKLGNPVGVNIGSGLTRSQAIAGFKLLDWYDWSVSRSFYLVDTDGSPFLIVHYQALPTSVDEATAGPFHYEIMATAS